MGRSTSRLVALMACLCLGMPGLAQEEFALKVGLESADFPDLDATPVIEADPGTVFEITGNMIVGSSSIEGDVGPQGWSWGVGNTTEGLTILSTTIVGTVSDATPAGLVDFGFVVNDLIDPANNDGKEGSVQAVVLSFTQPITLPPNTDQITAKNTYQVTVGDAEIVATIGFEDGLVGQGQPVANNVTYENQTQTPTLGEKQITITPPVVAEVGPVLCDNGIDDDNDGLIDCDDPDCAPECVPDTETICDNGLDDDEDGLTDCEDPDCEGTEPCLCVPTEPDGEVSCSDGEDNDCDGLVDGDDPDCFGGESSIRLALKTAGGDGAVTVKVGATFEAVGSIIPVGDPLEEGAQGWSISVAHDPAILEIQNGTFPTIDGTDAGDAFDGGFQKTEIVDPANNDGNGGFVSAVVLSFTDPIFLDPAMEQSIVRAQYQGKAVGTDTIAYLDGLQGGGQPVPNVVTIAGDTVSPDALIALDVTVEPGDTEPKSDFVRGDANDDGKVNIADPIWIINELVRGGPATLCQSAADANDDGDVDLSDSMYLINWRFIGGPVPTAPFSDCGQDPSPDSLDCPLGSVAGCSAQ